MNLITLLILIILAVAILPTWPYSVGWGYYPSAAVGIIALVFIIVLLSRGNP